MTAKLYFLVRTDMDTMKLSSGRIAAQVSHATNAFEQTIKNWTDNENLQKRYYEWSKQTPQGFGTAIVLNGGTLDNIQNVIQGLDPRKYIASLVIDPEYVIRDGEVTHIVPQVATCAYVFPLVDEYLNPLAEIPLL